MSEEILEQTAEELEEERDDAEAVEEIRLH